jgi:hypothetical protein
MSLEANIERIATALETIAGKLNAVPLQGSAPPAAAAEKPSRTKAEKVEAPKSAPEETEAPQAATEDDKPAAPPEEAEDDSPRVDPDDVTKEMVRKALMAYAEVSSQDAAKKLMAECGDGAKSLGMLDEDFYAPVYIVATERAAAAAADGETED